MFLLPLFAVGVLTAAAFSDSRKRPQEGYGYGEATLGRIPTPLWRQGTAGLRGEHMSWRHPLPSVQDRFQGYRPTPGGTDIGIRGPTHGWRYPMPRPWEEPNLSVYPEELHEEEFYGLSTGAAGIRGMHLPAAFTPEQIRAYNIDGADQGLQGGSVAPPG